MGLSQISGTILVLFFLLCFLRLCFEDRTGGAEAAYNFPYHFLWNAYFPLIPINDPSHLTWRNKAGMKVSMA